MKKIKVILHRIEIEEKINNIFYAIGNDENCMSIDYDGDEYIDINLKESVTQDKIERLIEVIESATGDSLFSLSVS